jgi:imidazolonepropionase-like amidohydrolase
MHERGAEIGLPQYSIDKLRDVRDAGLQSLEHLKAAGTRTGFGTDLFGALQSEQSRELSIRAEVDSRVDVLRSATSVNAELLGMAGKLGCIQSGAFADILVVDGDPLADLNVLQGQGERIRYIVRGGEFIRRPP